jgi:hypothetical protein
VVRAATALLDHQCDVEALLESISTQGKRTNGGNVTSSADVRRRKE